MDTVTLIRSAIRGLLKVADAELARRAACRRSAAATTTPARPSRRSTGTTRQPVRRSSTAGPKTATPAWLVLDGKRARPRGRPRPPALLATVVGQDLEDGDDGVLRIARKVAQDRVISTVDPEARHGHKTRAKSFDGYKGHAAIDPDSEIITETVVTPGNAGDASVAEDLIADLLADDEAAGTPRTVRSPTTSRSATRSSPTSEPPSTATTPMGPGSSKSDSKKKASSRGARPRTQRPPAGSSPRTASIVNVAEGTVTCPNGVTVVISPHRKGGGMAYFGMPAPPARCARSAPRPPVGAPSASARTKRRSPAPGCDKPTPPGATTTEPRGPRLSASSPTSCVAATAGAEPGYADGYGSTPISLSLPRQRTWRAWPRSRFVRSPAEDGRWPGETGCCAIVCRSRPSIASGINEWAFRPTSMAFSPQVHKAFSTATDRPTGKLNPCLTPPT